MQIVNILSVKLASNVLKSISGRELIKMQGYVEFTQNTVSFDHQAVSISMGVQTTLASPTAKTIWFGSYDVPL